MKSLFRLCLTILVIVLLVRWCKSDGKEVMASGKQVVAEVVDATLDKEITTEVSDDPYDILYGDNQEVETFTLREKLVDGGNKIKESFE